MASRDGDRTCFPQRAYTSTKGEVPSKPAEGAERRLLAGVGMKSVRIDTTGQTRCWNCGSTSFKEKRTFRSKMLVGVGSLLTKKKLKCNACGEYNQTGAAKPYKGPKSKRLGKKFGTLVNMVEGVDDFSDEIPDDAPDEEVALPVDPLERLKLLGELRASGVLTDEEFEVQKAQMLGSSPAVTLPHPPSSSPPPPPNLPPPPPGVLPPPPGSAF